MQTSDTRDHTVFAVDHASRGMRTLAVDGRMGASGDMLLGALVAAGADPAVLSVVEDSIDVRYEARETTKNGISATAVDVLLDSDDGSGDDDGGDGHDHGHSDEHSHDHDHSGEHSHDHDHTHAEGRGPQRTYAEVVDIVESMGLPEGVEADALAVFELLGRAEASVHGTDLASTHFHEVGADDAIADVVGVALLLEDLGVERVVTTPVSAGGGEVSMSHGTYPVPVPAVVEIARQADWSLQGGPIERELLTPTGAAILAHYADGVERLPAMEVTGSGYGAGGYDLPERPNVLRAIVGEGEGGLREDDITVLETHIDDATPEVLGSLQESLADAGARDVTVVPTTMKKSRPGHLVKVVVKPEDAERVARRLAAETGTLGVREHGAGHRWVADREVVTATILEGGERHAVAVKVAGDEGGPFDFSAEFDDAQAVARETGLPVREVTRRAEAAVRDGRADRLVHVTERDRWAALADGDAYTHPSLDEQGFVHCSTPEQVLAVAETNYRDADDPVLLVVDPDRVGAEIRYEEQPSGGYAHVYGPIERAAIGDVLDLPREDGRFVLPEQLRE
jgi:uncharacterized protein (TIGR00299 family) protein